MNQFFSFLAGLVAVVLILLKKSEENKHEMNTLKKEVDDAVDSCDINRINAIINHVSRL